MYHSSIRYKFAFAKLESDFHVFTKRKSPQNYEAGI